jgi:membrane-associated phospholipid phosphatase
MIAAPPAALLAAGLFTKDHYERNTALLAAEAFADVEILDLGLKYSTRRLRPNGFPPNANYSDSWWESGGNGFPSGHTIAAFAVATVISRRYPHQRWLPYVAYGLAATIGFSRLTLSAHFPADVLLAEFWATPSAGLWSCGNEAPLLRNTRLFTRWPMRRANRRA